MGPWIEESERADQNSSAQQKTSLESTGGHVRQQRQQQRQRWFRRHSVSEAQGCHDHEWVAGLDRRGKCGWQRYKCFQNLGRFFWFGRTTSRTPQWKPSKSWKCLIATECTRYGLVDLLCRPEASFSSCGRPSIVNYAVDIRKSLDTKVVLNDSVAMFQGIGGQTTNERNVGYAEDFCFSNSERRSQHGHKAGPS